MILFRFNCYLAVIHPHKRKNQLYIRQCRGNRYLKTPLFIRAGSQGRALDQNRYSGDRVSLFTHDDSRNLSRFFLFLFVITRSQYEHVIHNFIRKAGSFQTLLKNFFQCFLLHVEIKRPFGLHLLMIIQDFTPNHVGQIFQGIKQRHVLKLHCDNLVLLPIKFTSPDRDGGPKLYAKD